MSGYIQVKDHPLTTSLRQNYHGIMNDYIRVSSKYLGTKPNNLMGEILDQKESNGKLLYHGTIKSVFTRVAPESCSPTEYIAVWGKTENSKQLADARFLEKQELTPILEEVIRPYNKYVGTVGFNIMYPGAKLSMHYGMTSNYIRFHMGIICDPNAKFHVGTHAPRAWEPGKVWAFDDGAAFHGTTHEGVSERVILLLDIDKAAFDHLEEETNVC